MYTLVIIDMQDRFQVNGTMPVALACQREIKQAIEDGAHILSVEFKDCGPTIESLSSLYRDYAKAVTIEKSMNDGSKEIAAICDSRQLPKDLHITGVNTSYCVYYTVAGLVAKSPDFKMEVIPDACANTGYQYTQHEDTHKQGLATMRALKGVTIREQK